MSNPREASEPLVHPAPRSRTPAWLSAVWPWLGAAGSGVLLALCFPPWKYGGCAWFALTPLVCSVWFRRPPAKRAWLGNALLGYVFGLVFFTTTFSWLSALGVLFENTWLRGLPLLLAMYLALYPALWAVFIGWLAPAGKSRTFPTSPHNLWVGAVGAGAWAVLEWTRGWMLSGFGWNSLGTALHRDVAMIQVADLTGVAGLDWMVAFANLMAVIITRRILGEIGPRFLARIRWEFSATMLVIVVAFGYGARRLTQRPTGDTVPLRVAAIQPNIAQTDKFDPAADQRIFETIDVLTRAAALNQPDLLIWPESAAPRGMYADQANFDFVMEQAKHGDYALLIGTIDIKAGEIPAGTDQAPSDEPQRIHEYNAAVLITDRGQSISAYHKIHLVPFGEYLPLRGILGPLLSDLIAGDFDAGEEHTVFSLPSPPLRLAALICFEDTQGDLARRFVLNGAQLLVNITNDGWFLRTAAAEQHLANAVLRSVENRRWLVRCANTGVTCSIDPHGRIDRWFPPFVQGADKRTLHISGDPPVTFYTRYGDWFIWLWLALLAIGMGGRLLRRSPANS